MELLLISNSTNYNEGYLEHCIQKISEFLNGAQKIVFIPYAAVTFPYNDYEKKVNNVFQKYGMSVDSIHKHPNKDEIIEQAQAIVIGGGNTFMLLKKLYEENLIKPIRKAVMLNGAKYVGWSAGSNVACPTIKTTNDMPIVEPPTLCALNLVPFQINPHYTDLTIEGHAGETRQQRIEEFIQVNQNVYVVGLREGTLLEIKYKSIKLYGPRPARVFRYNEIIRDLGPDDDLKFLLNNNNHV